MSGIGYCEKWQRVTLERLIFYPLFVCCIWYLSNESLRSIYLSTVVNMIETCLKRLFVTLSFCERF